MENRNQHVPEGWEITKLGRLLKVKYGKDQKTIESSNGNYPILGTGGIIGRTNTALYSKPSVLIGRKGSIDRPYYMDTPFWTIDTLFYTEIINVVSPKYIYYYFCIIDWRKLEESTGVPSLSATAISNVKIPLPPLPEQRAIAEILTAADRLIFLKERLIDAKHKQKLWLMQNLLTGKIRLPGFLEEWREARLGDLGNIVAGGTPDTANIAFWNGNIAWLTPSEVTSRFVSKTRRNITELGLQSSSVSLLPTWTLMVCTRATVGACCINTVPMATNQGFKNLIPRNNDVHFLYYLLTLKKKNIVQKAAGSTFLEISKKDIENLVFKIPVLSEQSAIAAVLSAADKELDLLSRDVEQQKLVKKYLMQQLLTGRIRVKGANL